MISPSTPAALAGISVGAGPSTRTVVAAGHRPGELSVPAATNHDPAPTALGVTRTSLGPTARRPSLAGVDRRRSGPTQDQHTDNHHEVSTGFRAFERGSAFGGLGAVDAAAVAVPTVAI